MYTARVVITALLAAYLTFSAGADFVRYNRILVEMAKAHVPESWLTWLGVVKAAAVIGLLAGLVIPPVGLAAAAGVVLFFVGAVMTHVRARYYAVGPALSFLILGVVTLGLTAALS